MSENTVNPTNAILQDDEDNILIDNDKNNQIFRLGNAAYTIIERSALATNTYFIGNGNNNITDKSALSNNTFIIGNGNNTITGSNNYSIFSVGDGDNTITDVKNITVGDGNNSITTAGNITVGDGNNNILHLAGDKEIKLGGGNNTLIDKGYQTTITGGSANASNSIEISGGGQVKCYLTGNNYYSFGEYGGGGQTIQNIGNATVDGTLRDPGGATINIKGNALIKNMQRDNIDITGNSTIVGSNNINFNNLGNNTTIIASNNNTIGTLRGSSDATSKLINSEGNVFNAVYGNIDIQGGNQNQFNYVNGNINFYDMTSGKQTVNYFTGGSANIEANGELYMTFNSYSDETTVFNSASGNQTLDSAASQGAFAVYANTSTTQFTRLVATTGDGDDTLTAGHGYSLFTGGKGANLFAFNKEDASGGYTVISDFSASEDNQVALFDYGLTRSSLSKLLKTAQDDGRGNTILNLENHSITFEGVTASDLSTNQFFVYNSK